MAVALPLVGAGIIALGAGATGTRALGPCNGHTAVLCSTVVAPLDPSGQKPGTVRLHVEVLRPTPGPGVGGKVKALFLIAGGPGQGSAHSFDLAKNGQAFQRLFPGYTLVAFDDRGTGHSGAQSCRWGADYGASASQVIGECGESLGSLRLYYSTVANVADTDAVRRSLGLQKIALLGVSYGTTQALAYASTYPTHVSRLVLDSIALPNSDDVFQLKTIEAIRGSLNSLCANGVCRGVTRDPAGDLGKLANMLQAKPLIARVQAVAGIEQLVRVDGTRLLILAIDSDLNPGVAAELPAAVSAALAGRPRLLARLSALEDYWEGSGTLGIDAPVEVATNCADGRFPWSPTTPVADRPAIFASALAAVPPAKIAPFGDWVASIGSAVECEDWPTPSGGVLVKNRPYPNVPVLILSGSRDTRTPEADARTVAKEFPKSRLLIVNGAGHSLFGSSGCATRFIGAWLIGKKPISCPRELPLLDPIGPFPAPQHTSWSPTRAFTLAKTTLQEAEATWLTTRGSPLASLSGLLGGTLTPLSSKDPQVESFQLSNYCDVRGVVLTGTMSFRFYSPGKWLGSVVVRVNGSLSAGGLLVAGDGRLSGLLGGKHLAVRTVPR